MLQSMAAAVLFVLTTVQIWSGIGEAVFAADATAAADQPGSVLAKYDGLYNSQLTVIGRDTSRSVDPGKRDRTETYQFELTLQDDLAAIIRSTDNPSAQVKSEVTLWDGEKAAFRQIHSSPQGKKRSIITLDEPDSSAYRFPIIRSLWGIGRGYVQFTDRPAAFRDTTGGLFEIEAGGRGLTKATGTWHLTIERSTGHLVRQARFLRGDSLMISVTNEGALHNGGCVVPRTATVSLHSKRGVITRFDCQFISAKLEFDHAVFDRAKTLCDSPAEKGSLFLDERVTPPETMVVGYTKRTKVRHAADMPIRRPSPLRFWLIVGNVVSFSIVFIILALRRGKWRSVSTS